MGEQNLMTEGERIVEIGTKVDMMLKSQESFQSDMKSFQTEIRTIIGQAFETIREIGKTAITDEELEDKLKLRDSRIAALEASDKDKEIRLQKVEKRPSWLIATFFTIGGSLIVGLITTMFWMKW